MVVRGAREETWGERKYLCLPHANGRRSDDGEQVAGARDAQGQDRVRYGDFVRLGFLLLRGRVWRTSIVIFNRLDGRSKGCYRGCRSLNIDLTVVVCGRPGMEAAGWR